MAVIPSRFVDQSKVRTVQKGEGTNLFCLPLAPVVVQFQNVFKGPGTLFLKVASFFFTFWIFF